uniref:Small ribosomal subunit protein uS10 domain-containing protein n=1 Tax=Solanum lycopersicum TaxID=4081 RepID=A0A3Q7IXX9_SOLLC
MRQRRALRRVSQKERPPKVTTTKIGIVIRSFDHPFLENHFWGLPPNTRKIGLPESRVLYTVLRSPHIDKKSREQFFMKIKKEFLVIKIERHELRKKFFRTLYFIFGAIAGVMGTCFSVLIRMELARPDDQILSGNHQIYNVLITTHAF